MRDSVSSSEQVDLGRRGWEARGRVKEEEEREEVHKLPENRS